MSENPQILNEYLDYLTVVKAFSKTSIETYNINLLQFFEFIKEYCDINKDVKDFNKFILLQVKESDVNAYLVYCNYAKDNNPYTREKKIIAIRGFYNWLLNTFKNDYIINPTSNIGSIKKVVRLPKYLNLEQAKQIQTIFTTENSKNPFRNNAIICLFLSAGLRVSELISIKIEDINFEKKSINIVGKGNKERIAFFSESCEKKLKEYINTRNINKNDYLFVSYKNTKLARNTINVICKKAYKLIGIEEDKHFSPHTLRHTSATIMYQYVKHDTLLLKEFLGHSSIASTQIYTHIYDEKVKNAVESNPLSNFRKEGM
jgi:site-specific recombinase XerD